MAESATPALHAPIAGTCHGMLTHLGLSGDGRAVKRGATLRLVLGQPVRRADCGRIVEAIEEVERRVRALHAGDAGRESSPTAASSS